MSGRLRSGSPTSKPSTRRFRNCLTSSGLAEALGCHIDDLLTGGDEDFDHPRRRHAALIAARLGRINTAQSRVNAARARGELTRLDELCLDEPALLASVHKCRGWVTSPTADIKIASGLERELDDHLGRLIDVMQRVDGRADSVHARNLANLPAPTAAQPSRTGGPAVGDADARTAVATATPTVRVAGGRPGSHRFRWCERGSDGYASEGGGDPERSRRRERRQRRGRVPATPVLGEESPAAATPRRPGRRTTMWSRPAHGEDAYVCEMVMQGASVELVLVCGDRELAVHPCKNMDKAFAQSSKWKRIPDPEAHFAGSAA